MHSDYFSNAAPRIRVFSDRIEFFNPGGLPKALKYILKEDFSMPRNKVIAKIFRVIKLSESIGSGFNKMFDGWKSYYKNTPKITENFDNYKITFLKPAQQPIITKEQQALLRSMPVGEFFDMINKKGSQKRWSEKVVGKGGQKTWVNKWSGKVVGKGGQKLTVKQLVVLAILNKKPDITRKELAEVLKINQSAVQKYLNRFKKLGILEREGPDKGGYWKVLKK